MVKELEKLLKKHQIDKCDVIYVASSGFAVYWDKDFVDRTILALLNTFKNKTIIMPSFSFDFCDTGVYNVKESSTYCGIVSEKFMKMDGVKRTIATPMHNVSIWGKKQNYFLNKSYTSSFGLD